MLTNSPGSSPIVKDPDRETFALPNDLYRKAKARVGRLLGRDARWQFRGSFGSYADAVAAVPADRLVGYDNDEVVDVSFEKMCRVELWDYPVLLWLQRLLPGNGRLIDAGGHMGTKFRAFQNYLRLPAHFEWMIYDVPAIVRAGRERAVRDGLDNVTFHDRLESLPPSEILLASGLFQYINMAPAEFLSGLEELPKHLLLNKVATRDDGTIVTLECFPSADVPYQIRDRLEFEESLFSIGYRIRDSWEIPALSRKHPDFGQSISRGYYAELGW